MIAFVLFGVFFATFDPISSECTDIYGRSITPGIHFIPGPDICQLCVCDNTTPKWCKRVLCSPPQNCKSFVMGSSCCDYSCLDNTIPSGDIGLYEVDRRFVITVGTALFLLAVLLLAVHKIRNRGIHVRRLQNRQLTEDRRSIGSIGFITGSIGYLNLSNGHHFDDHPLVHFPVYKPHANYFPRGEAPPPYEEAMADTALSVSVTTQLLTNEREMQEFNQQRRRCNSAGVAMVANQPRLTYNERCVCEPQQQIKDNRTHEIMNVYGCAAQHRTIPLPICVTPESLNQHVECSPHSNNSLNNRSCPVHSKKGNEPVCGTDTEHRSRANSTSHAQPTTSTGHNTCPPQFHFEAAHGAGSSHRTLPLSASLSSPLPSTSENCDRQAQFTTFSSAINISSVEGKEPTPNTLQPLTKQPIQAKKSLPTVSVTNESQHSHKNKNSSTKCTNSKERPTTATSESVKEPKEPKPEPDSSQLVEDYHAECENCNLNVNTECDVTDEYFSEQETMTLQRKLHEVSAAKNNDQSMKVSLTLPTNSRTRRCSSKNRKSGRWNAKESPFKTMLEYVSSEEEEPETEKSQPKKNDNEENI